MRRSSPSTRRVRKQGRLEGLEERIGELGAQELDPVEVDLDAAWRAGRHGRASFAVS
ncbi:MAG: hypothetical protein M3065_13010 [Actinomycetota bacterium]|nr:hypothetical protein [Actinomycetota bacterium]